ncbi:hypothetical protein SDC9_154858 [bioreactor metagenome]|uniref:Uncharacterized protein n=1 Tax=bioreactor metagenome TaxID=1076179 RepID=A0A645F071_9ZZZZ
MTGISQVGDRAEGLFSIIAGRRIQQHIASGQTGFHLDDFLALDVELCSNRINFVRSQGFAQGQLFVGHGGIGLQVMLHRAQIEEQLALGLGRRDLDHAPVLQDIFVNFRLDPVHGVADQTHALIGIEAFDSLHQAHIALLNQVAVRQAIAQVLARDGDNQTQVGHHQTPGGVQIIVFFELASVVLLFLKGEHWHTIDRRDIGIQVAQRRYQRPGVRGRQGSSNGAGGSFHCRFPFFHDLHISTPLERVLKTKFPQLLLVFDGAGCDLPVDSS